MPSKRGREPTKGKTQRVSEDSLVPEDLFEAERFSNEPEIEDPSLFGSIADLNRGLVSSNNTLSVGPRDTTLVPVPDKHSRGLKEVVDSYGLEMSGPWKSLFDPSFSTVQDAFNLGSFLESYNRNLIEEKIHRGWAYVWLYLVARGC